MTLIVSPTATISPLADIEDSIRGSRIVIGRDDCWIGANTVLVDGAILGRGCVVGASALVRGKFPPFAILAGVPARIVGYRE